MKKEVDAWIEKSKALTKEFEKLQETHGKKEVDSYFMKQLQLTIEEDKVNEGAVQPSPGEMI